MPFIGNAPSNNFVSLKRQDITGDGTASYTLDYKVASVNDVLIYVNHVKQDPSSYSISGTSLTMGGTVSSSDDFYIIYLGQGLQTVTPADNTITLDMLNATGTKDSTTFLRGDNTFASAGGTNTPAFYADTTASQSLTDSTFLTMIYANEIFDTDNAYDTTTGKFTVPSGKAGKYFFYGCVAYDINSTYTSSSNLSLAEIVHYNSSDVQQNKSQVRQNFNYCNVPSIGVGGLFDMEVGDYAVLRGYITATTSTYNAGELSYFKGFKLVE